MPAPLLILAIISGLMYVLSRLANRYFDDNDQDQFWHDNYTVLDCPHVNKTDVTVHSCVTCETVHTICDDCGEVLNVRHDC